MTSTASATYTKLRSGEWGIRVMGRVAAGDRVTVKKQSGESKVETIGSVVWSGQGVTLCSIARAAASPRREDCRRYGWDGTVGSRSYYSSGQYDQD